MSAYNSDCAPFDACGPCGTLPGGFVRLRYFFGKRMGVADFVDEQRYHAGKQRFHNQRLHGAGTLCGLAVSRQDATDVLLRVSKGAAIDACGREIVVGADQCLDLDAWFRRELAERRVLDDTWPASALVGGNLPLIVVVRYRDCATGPEPAPRDTCSCDAAGCDFGRVREEFELDVVTAVDPEATNALPLTPSLAKVEAVVGGAFGATTLTRGLATYASVGCPEANPDGWLQLAAFTATLTPDAGGELHVTDLGPIEGRTSLLAQTALLQELLKRELGAMLEAGGLNDGPEVLAMSIVPVPSSTLFEILLDLSGPLVPETVPVDAFTLSRLHPSGPPRWTDVATTSNFLPSPNQLHIRFDNDLGGGNVFLEPGGNYRIAIDPIVVPMATPMCDDQMRPLRPLRGVFQFGVERSGTDLVPIPPPYAR